MSFIPNHSIVGDVKVVISNFDQVKEKMNFFNKNMYCKVKFKSPMFERLYNNLNELNWVDIENEYFDMLSKNMRNKAQIIKLNKEFNYLRQKLEEYLVKLETDKIKFRHNPFSRLFSEKIEKEDIVSVRLQNNIAPDSVYFLNFNYTDTIHNYYDHVRRYLSDAGVSHNYIHGELEKQNNPLIFGFGDELDKNYLEFEDLKNPNLFTHIKSFKYSLTSNYHDLLRFVDSGDFQVYVIGHSCGLSDRTMLNHIFEHDHCKSIKIFYYQKQDGTDDFTEKTYDISRHFKNKGLMREKLVPKSKSQPMPSGRRFN